MGNIKFEIFPVYPWQFAILEIESKKKGKDLVKGASQDAPFAFIAKLIIQGKPDTAMMKKKVKRKKAATGAAKQRSTRKTPRTKKQTNAAEVRNDIAKIVKSGAKKITKAVMDQAMTGQLAPAKYLFEMAAIYPPSTDGSESSKEEECFAKTLMDRLNLPDKPIALDEEDEGIMKSASPPAAGDEEETGGKESEECEPGSEAAGGEGKHVSALV